MNCYFVFRDWKCNHTSTCATACLAFFRALRHSTRTLSFDVRLKANLNPASLLSVSVRREPALSTMEFMAVEQENGRIVFANTWDTRTRFALGQLVDSYDSIN